MTRPDLNQAFRMFAIKIAIYWVAKLVICQLDSSRLICSVISKGFVPCLATFAVMDFLIIPQLRKQLEKLRQKRTDHPG